MKAIKYLLVWLGMILMAITTPIWHIFKYDVSIEANIRK